MEQDPLNLKGEDSEKQDSEKQETNHKGNSKHAKHYTVLMGSLNFKH